MQLGNSRDVKKTLNGSSEREGRWTVGGGAWVSPTAAVIGSPGILSLPSLHTYTAPIIAIRVSWSVCIQYNSA